MALFESYERRIDKINGVLAQYGIGSVEWASRAASRRPPFKEGIMERESSPLCSVSVSLGISGTSPSPSLSPEAVPSEVFLPPRSTVFTVSSSPDTCAGAAAETALREELPLLVPWPQAVSAAKAPKLASNTRERIKAIIFMNLRKCVKCTGRNQRLFALALTQIGRAHV